MRVDPNLAAALLEFGRIGFVLKHGDESEPLKAIDSGLNGKPYLTRLRAEDYLSAKATARGFSKEITQRQRGLLFEPKDRTIPAHHGIVQP
jgi:DNA-binding NarL/FixJ family response regulator